MFVGRLLVGRRVVFDVRGRFIQQLIQRGRGVGGQRLPRFEGALQDVHGAADHSELFDQHGAMALPDGRASSPPGLRQRGVFTVVREAAE